MFHGFYFLLYKWYKNQGFGFRACYDNVHRDIKVFDKNEKDYSSHGVFR